jgi:hypothetical protein
VPYPLLTLRAPRIWSEGLSLAIGASLLTFLPHKFRVESLDRRLSTPVVMKVFQKLFFGAVAVAAGAATQHVFEPADFNVTDALIGNGINVSAIPELTGLAVETSLEGCAIAVSLVGPVLHTLR